MIRAFVFASCVDSLIRIVLARSGLVQSITRCTRLMYRVLYLKGNVRASCMIDLPAEARQSLVQEFFDFLKTFGIIGLAIAFVIGQAASKWSLPS